MFKVHLKIFFEDIEKVVKQGESQSLGVAGETSSVQHLQIGVAGKTSRILGYYQLQQQSTTVFRTERVGHPSKITILDLICLLK